MIVLGAFSTAFRGSGAHVRTALSLKSQLDLGGSGGSGNRCFCVVGFRCKKKRYPRGFFFRFVVDLGGQRVPTGFQTGSQNDT